MQTAAEFVQERALKALYRDSQRESVTQTITEEAEGCWYLIRCAPGRARTAFNWMSRRRFGVFDAKKGMKQVLPGYIAAYVFNMAKMEERILAVPGVLGILRGHNHIPFPISIAFIRNLASEAWNGDALPPQRPKVKKAKKQLLSKDRKRKTKLRRALKHAERAGELTRAVDIRAQITALRQKFSAPHGVVPHVAP